MVAQVQATTPKCAALLRALNRAKTERLVCFANADGTWACKAYTLTVTGPHAADVSCNCIAGSRGLVCKHAVCVIFCRKHGLRPIRPVVAYEGAEKAAAPFVLTASVVSYGSPLDVAFGF